jgi:hypothetical protein
MKRLARSSDLMTVDLNNDSRPDCLRPSAANGSELIGLNLRSALTGRSWPRSFPNGSETTSGRPLAYLGREMTRQDFLDLVFPCVKVIPAYSMPPHDRRTTDRQRLNGKEHREF